MYNIIYYETKKTEENENETQNISRDISTSCAFNKNTLNSWEDATLTFKKSYLKNNCC